jgi:phosphate uptake regulator
METRKLQQVGGGTFTVSIPKDWATDHDLEAGAEIHLYTHTDGSVVVRSAERDGGHLDAVRVELDADATAPERATRPLRAAQGVGFESVTLVHPDGFDDDQRRAVRSFVADVVGAEVVVEREDELRVQNMLDAGDVSIRQSAVQLAYVARSVHDEGTTALVDAEDGTHERLADRRREADRLFGMVARHCNRSLVSFAAVDRLGVGRADLFDYYETARQLRGVAAAGVRLARIGDLLSAPPAAGVADVLGETAETARGIVDDAANAVLNGADAETAHAALDRGAALREDTDAIEAALLADTAENEALPTREELSRTSRADAVGVARALSPRARTAEHGEEIARVALTAEARGRD